MAGPPDPADDVARIERVIAALPPLERAALALRYYEALSLDAIGRVLELEETEVLWRLDRARSRIRHALARA